MNQPPPDPPPPSSPASGRPPLEADAFDFPPGLLWVMHCADGPVPKAAARAITKSLALKTQPWTLSWQEHVLGIPAALKAEVAGLLRVPAGEISLTTNTSTGLSMVAQGFPWQAGDEVVLPLGEFPSNYWSWRALASRGVAVREVPLWDGHRAGDGAWKSVPPPADVDPEATLLAALGPRTRVLAVSWVRFQDGLRLDLRRLARGCTEVGVDLVVDGIQGAGTQPVDLEGVAAFVSGGHKGLLGLHGQGFTWTTPSFTRSLAPPGGWLCVEDFEDFSRPSTDYRRDWAADASRLDSGLPNLVGCAALSESLRLLNVAGAENIAQHVGELQRSLLGILAGHAPLAAEVERLGALLDANRLGPILAFHHQGRGADSLLDCLRRGQAANIHSTMREGYLRVALHGWHSRDDVERLGAWLRTL